MYKFEMYYFVRRIILIDILKSIIGELDRITTQFRMQPEHKDKIHDIKNEISYLIAELDEIGMG